MPHDSDFPFCNIEDREHEGPCVTHVSPEAAAIMRAHGVGPAIKAAPSDLALIEETLTERMGEYFADKGYGHRLNTRDLTGVVADLIVAAVKKARRDWTREVRS